MHYHDGEDALVCGDKFDDTVEEGATKNESSELDKTAVEENPTEGDLNKKEKEDIKNSKRISTRKVQLYYKLNM